MSTCTYKYFSAHHTLFVVVVYFSPHYHPASPKTVSSIDFEFAYLPFIDPSSYPCPELNKGYSQFAGQTLNDDEDEGASSFSSLPTSQFTLRPCVNIDQTGHHVLERPLNELPSSSKDTQANGVSGDGLLKDNTTPQMPPPGDEIVWKKFTQSQVESKPSAASAEPPSSGNSDNSSSSANPSLCALTVPSTHLSSLETGLPIQIHVDNLMHFPKKDSKTNLSSESSSSKAPTPTHPAAAPMVTSSSSCMAINTTNTGTVQSNKHSQQPINEVLMWFKDSPSSIMSSLNDNNCSKRSRSNRFRCMLPSSLAKSVTTRFKTEKPKPEPPQVTTTSTLPSIAPSVPPLPLSTAPSSSTTPSSPLPHTLLSNQHQIVSSLINDPKKFESFVRDKKHFVTLPSANHQSNSTNGTTTSLELNHKNKLQTDLTTADKAIKHALAARYIHEYVHVSNVITPLDIHVHVHVF